MNDLEVYALVSLTYTLKVTEFDIYFLFSSTEKSLKGIKLLVNESFHVFFFTFFFYCLKFIIKKYFCRRGSKLFSYL